MEIIKKKYVKNPQQKKNNKKKKQLQINEFSLDINDINDKRLEFNTNNNKKPTNCKKFN